MSVIHIDFRDKEHYALVRLVEEQLRAFGFTSMSTPVPDDAVACALDEVKLFSSNELRKAALLKLERHFRKRYQSENPSPIPLARTKD